MKPAAVDPTRYRVNVVTFSIVREPGAPTRRRLNEPAAAVEVARALIADDAREHFWVLLLDAQNGLVATHEVSTGALSASLVHPREVFGPAMRLMGVASIIAVHNHPSGDPTPSREDRRLTRELAEAGTLLQIRLHDHLIVGNGTQDYVSLASLGGIL